MLFPDGVKFYPDVQNGVRGYNTDPQRGADTFCPFNGGELQITLSGSASSMSATSTVMIKNIGYKTATIIGKTGSSNPKVNNNGNMNTPIDVSGTEQISLSMLVAGAGYGNDPNIGTATFVLT